MRVARHRARPAARGLCGIRAKPVDPSKLPKVECSEVKFSEAFLARYPKAPAACIEARELEGKRYAKFDAKVYLKGPEITTVNLLNTKGDVVDTFSLKPGPDQKIKINGKDTKFSDFASARRSLSGYRKTAWRPPSCQARPKMPGQWRRPRRLRN